MNDVGHFTAIPPDYEDDWGQGWRHSISWCNEHVGEQGVDWWYAGLGQFVFGQEQDRTMFALRWA